MKELYKTLKDHKNSFMKDLVHGSYVALLEEERSRFQLTESSSDVCAENVVRVVLVNKSFQESLKVRKWPNQLMNDYASLCQCMLFDA